MKFSLQFLKEFVDIDIEPQELAEKFTMAGLEIGSLEKIGKDYSFEAEVTSNRPDLLSILGLSYEAAALLGEKVKIDKKQDKVKLLKGFDVEIKENKECPFYLGKVIKNVKVKPSPEWLKSRLLACGINPVNNVVDITNYCMLKWGQPLHAFDLNLVKEKIIVRKAKEKESLLCIDDKERVLDKSNLVIADNQKVLAIAGIIGGKESEIKDNTSCIFLEAALFSSLSIRKTRRSLGIDTDSSYRFERNVSPLYLERASLQAAELIQELAGANTVSATKKGKLPQLKRKNIEFSQGGLNKLMGTYIKKEESRKILKSIGAKIEEKKEVFNVIPPLFRTDLKIEQDLFEEVSRIWGYSKIEPQVPSFFQEEDRDKSLYEFKNKLRNKLITLGFKEIVTYSVVNKDHVLLKDNKAETIRIKNPLRADEDTLRPFLYVGQVESIKYNVSRKHKHLQFFEIADTFSRSNACFEEIPKISLGMHSQSENDFYLFKAKIDKFIEELGLTGLGWENQGFRGNFSNFCQFGKDLWVGVLKNEITRKLGLDNVFIAELDLTRLIERVKPPVYNKVNEFPWVERDISLGLKQGREFKDIEKIIKKRTQNLLKEYKILDVYKGKNIEKGFLGLTLRLFYQHNKRTLKSEEVDSVHFGLRDALDKEEFVFLR